MSQSEAGPSVAATTASAFADANSQKPKAQQSNKPQQQNKAPADNRFKAQQNKERAAQGRARKVNSVTFTDTGSAMQDSSARTSASSDAIAKQLKKQPKQDAPKSQAARQAKAPTQFKSKVVIRRLPPNLPEDVFWKAVSPWIRDKTDCQAPSAADTPTQTISESSPGEASTSQSASNVLPSNSFDATVDYKKFVVGKLKTDTNKQNKHARAYVRFLDPQSLVEFHKAFDGHIFRDSKGKESVAIVEFAPYQKVVLASSASGQRGRRAKPDPKQGTIDKDAEYLSFVERLSKAGDDVKRSEGELLASLHDVKGREKEKEAKEAAGKATPLLQHLRAVKMAKLESAAAIKKAKKMEKAAAKAAAGKSAVPAPAPVKGGGAAAGASAEHKAKAKKSRKEKAKEKAKSDPTEGAGVKPGEGASTKKEKSKKRKGKASGDPDGAADGKAQSSAQKDPKKAPSKKPDAKTTNGADAAQGEGAGKGGKPKSKPPRRKGGPKDKQKSSSAVASGTNPAAAQPSKVQILKRDS
ncbi:hypothetical protein EX895_000464 [Sporisorium graminicola]|uniref:UPF3 domain-containing protein n=1 Tax=Sporisorium graminicola TaxID=280036 RepID=A0A4U7L174_9BASI|nr:hypothetical protein EX895_000464 [Sporisorium graminicola]TKY90466.1 hypothetical protein EX895_000464 [Sporisorium graminicola]